jgi:hypothetical protein
MANSTMAGEPGVLLRERTRAGGRLRRVALAISHEPLAISGVDLCSLRGDRTVIDLSAGHLALFWFTKTDPEAQLTTLQ